MFYKLLLSIINKTPKQDTVIKMSDFNAKIGDKIKGVEKYIGTHGLGNMIQNFHYIR